MAQIDPLNADLHDATRPQTDLLIVIPCLNEEAHIGGVLAGLLADEGARGALIVVADGGSTDRTRALVGVIAADHPWVVWLDNPGRIQSAGVNLAVVRYGRGRRWLLRVDAHAIYPPAFASSLLAVAHETGARSVVVPMLTVGRGCFQKAVAAAQNSGIGTGGSAHRHVGASAWVDHGHHALMAIADYAAAGGYDETLAANEDAELDARLAQAGVRIWLAGDVAITYLPRAAPGPLFRQYLKYGQGRAKNAARHGTRLKLRQALPLAVAPACGLAVAGLLLAPFGFLWLTASALLWTPALLWAAACLGAGLLVAAQRRERCALGSGFAAMIMHLAWSLGFWRQVVIGPPPGSPPGPLRFG